MSAPKTTPGRVQFGEVERAALAALRRLAEPGAFALVSRGLDAAAIYVPASPPAAALFSLAPSAAVRRVGAVDPRHLAAFWSRGWVAAVRRTPRLGRYEITGDGRRALRSLRREKARAKREAAGVAA